MKMVSVSLEDLEFVLDYLEQDRPVLAKQYLLDVIKEAKERGAK